MDNGPADEFLLEQFRRGDRSALEVLARRYETALLGLASGLLGGRSDAARDVVQETWMRVIRYAGTFRGRSGFKTWLYRIAINQCHTARSRQQRRGRSLDEMGEAAGCMRAEDDRKRSPEHGEDLAWLREKLRCMNDDRRLVLLLCYHEGMTHEQAAAVLEVPVGTLKSRLHAALMELRRQAPSEARP